MQIKRLERELQDSKEECDKKLLEITDLNEKITALQKSESSKQSMNHLNFPCLLLELLCEIMNSFIARIECLEEKLEALKQANREKVEEIDSLNKIIAEANTMSNKIHESHASALNNLAKLNDNGTAGNILHQKNQLKFKVHLCCFENITAPDIEFIKNDVKFEGKFSLEKLTN